MTVSFKRDGIESSGHSVNPIGAFSCVTRYRQLLVQLIRRDILGRYRGSFMGLLWSFVQPLLMLAIYTVVFGFFMKQTWRGTTNPLEFSLVLFSGLILFNFLTECLSRTPAIILSNPNYVRKIVFPLEILPWVTVSAALFHTALSLVAWMVMALLIDHNLHWTLIYLPLLLFPLMLMSVGLCWFLSATGVFIRDVGQTVPLVVLAMMFLSPLFYPVENVPLYAQKILMANPLTFVIEQARLIMWYGSSPDFRGLAIYWFASFAVAWLGYAWFQHARDGFADVL